MKVIDRIIKNTTGLINAITRFPLTIIFLVVVAILNSMMINNYNLDYNNYILALLIGIFLNSVAVVIYERFFTKFQELLALLLISIVVTLMYYFVYLNVDVLKEAVMVRTIVILFSLFIAFLWVPSIKNEVSFNESFMAGFKAIFTSLFYAAIIMLGMILIYAATDTLLFNVPNDIYMQTTNLVFVLFASTYFLSLIPEYPGKKAYQENELFVKEMMNKLDKFTTCPKFLEILLSYIVIPLASIFTLILLIYVVINISGSFWRDDLLEVMLVAYIIVVIMIYILTSRINNPFANFFRKVFPKILIFIVLFQTSNSIIRIGIRGLTYGRYYVIMFGVFALISGIIFSIKPIKKNGLVPMVLIICIIISLLPFVDAFSISEKSQISFLENTLKDNNMLIDNTIVINDSIDDTSKDKIIESVSYLNRMDYTGDIVWLPKGFDYYNDFEKVFGFSIYKSNTNENNNISLYMNNDNPIDISGYDFLVQTSVHYDNQNDGQSFNYTFNKDSNDYSVVINGSDGIIALYDLNDNLIIKIETNQIINKYKDYSNGELTNEQAELVFDNDQATIKLIIQNINIYDISAGNDFDAGMYILVKIK